ncbi:IclR family transcriptional regulator [Roseixanthobacter glucoisosaccharinicivorans]|uniref:IclR family transcriptional regulator n=1 Tax=Roseixanthobacter glucoisosaccharinicivorans TaxID=3119923 RepID=UPI003726B118
MRKPAKSKIFEEDEGVRSVAAVGDMADSPVVKSAERVLRILEYFDEIQRDARVTEIAAHLQFPQSSTSALLKSLAQLGYLDYDRVRRTFLPTARVALLGTWLNEGPVHNGRLLRLMEEVSRESRDTIILAVRNGIYSQYIHVVQATTPIRYHVPQGSRRLLAWSGTGFALLMRAPDEEVRALVARTNAEAPSDRPRIDYRAALGHVHEARRAGYFFSRALVSPGAGALAMPLPDGIERRNRPMVIAVSGVLEDIERREHRIIALLRDTIERYLVSD